MYNFSYPFKEPATACSYAVIACKQALMVNSGVASPTIQSRYANFNHYHYSVLQKLIVLIVYKHGNIYIAVWNRRAGYATDGEMRACSGEIQFRISARNVRFSKYEMSIITCMVLFTTFVQTKFRLYSLHYFSKYNIFKQTFN